MYNPTSSCGLIAHILLKYPILVVILGLAAAANFVSPMVYDTESSRFQSEIKSLESKLSLDRVSEAKKMFEAIIDVESDGGGHNTVHPDGVSHAPAGLTMAALKDVCNRLKVCSCEKEALDKTFSSGEESAKYTRLYFYGLVYRFGSVETAVIAFNVGPTKVASMIREGKKLPQLYLQRVKSKIK